MNLRKGIIDMGKFKEYLIEGKEMNYTKEMEDWFIERTNRHISLVQKYADKIENYDLIKFKGLVERTKEHDKSKFANIEKIPYIFVSWSYHSKDLGKEFNVSDEIKNKMHAATYHHVKHNKHHPEYYDKNAEINKNDRDKKPEKIVDAANMKDIDIGEMVSDWLAMSEEKGTGLKKWANDNVNKRWKFTSKQTKLIYELIKEFGD